MVEFGSPKILVATKQAGRKKVKRFSLFSCSRDWVLLLLLNSVTSSSKVAKKKSFFCTCKLKLTAQNGSIYGPEMLLCCGVRSNFEGGGGVVVVFVSVQTYDGVGHFDCKKKLSYINLRVACLEVSSCCCCCSAVIVIDRHHPTARLMPIRFVDHPLQFSFHLPSFTDNSQKCRL